MSNTHQKDHLAKLTRLAIGRLHLDCPDSARIRMPANAKSGSGAGVVWTERGVPQVSAPTGTAGLVSRSVTGQLRGSTAFD
jgi:hypothetical protein